MALLTFSESELLELANGDHAAVSKTWESAEMVTNVKSVTIVKPVSFSKTNASVILDLIRGLAAILVLLEHWRNIFFIDFGQLTAHRILFAPFYLICSAGHQAVIIFFVLSGYLISSSVFKTLKRGTWSWKEYLTHRLLRLWIVLIPGLLLCALWDGLGLHLNIAANLYSGRSGNHMIGNVAATHTAQIFWGNLFFLQTIRTQTFGSDGALWSLANEFWYYILFPLGLLSTRRTVSVSARVLYFIAFLITAWFVGRGIFESFPIWLFGTALALIPPRKFNQLSRIVAVAVYVPVFFLLEKAIHIPGLIADYALAVCTFLLLLVMLSATSAFESSGRERFSRSLSRFSFTLYVGHTPFCVLLAALILGDRRWSPSPLHLLFGLIVLGVVLAYSYGVAYVTEFQTGRVRSWLEPSISG